jgi:hypothetical protein
MWDFGLCGWSLSGVTSRTPIPTADDMIGNHADFIGPARVQTLEPRKMEVLWWWPSGILGRLHSDKCKVKVQMKAEFMDDGIKSTETV